MAQEYSVVLHVRIGVDGRVKETKLSRTDAPAELEAEIVEQSRRAMAEARFQPATQNGKAVECWVEVPFKYNLEGEEG